MVVLLLRCRDLVCDLVCDMGHDLRDWRLLCCCRAREGTQAVVCVLLLLWLCIWRSLCHPPSLLLHYEYDCAHPLTHFLPYSQLMGLAR